MATPPGDDETDDRADDQTAATADGPVEPASVEPASVEPAPVTSGPPRRAPMALVTWAFVILVLVIVAGLLVVKVTRGTPAVATPTVAMAPAATVQAAATVPSTVFDTVGSPAPDGPLPVLLSGQSPLVVKGKAAVVYVGSEFCPYCAALRWSLVVAMSRFGTFDHLGQTSSSGAEVFPGLQSFSFEGSTYKSRYLSWSAVEEYGPMLAMTWPAGFPALGRLGRQARSLVEQFGTGSGATLPFVDIGNRMLITGADIGFSPGDIQGLSMAQIASDLAMPTSPVTEAVVGAANVITAGLCASTNERPVKVCRSSGVRAGATRLGL
jgi:Domain of unknown function (DUF929)